MENMSAEEIDKVIGEDVDIADKNVGGRNIKNSVFDKIGLKRPSPRITVKKAVALIAAASLIIFCMLAVAACAREAQEYSDAIEFFENHDLSTEGLTRSEIKEVYKDIRTNSFSYSKTMEVVNQNNIIYRIPGYEVYQIIPQTDGSSDIVNTQISNYNRNIFTFDKIAYSNSNKKDGTWYSVSYDYNSTTGEVNSSNIIKLEGETPVWATSIRDFTVDCGFFVKDVMFVTGSRGSATWIAKISSDGKVEWSRPLHPMINRSVSYPICGVFDNDDGTYSVIGYGRDISTSELLLVFSKIGSDGVEISHVFTAISRALSKVSRLGDGYMAISAAVRKDDPQIMIIDKEGNIEEIISYSENGFLYHFTDMTEFGGKIYISGYTVPKIEGELTEDDFYLGQDSVPFSKTEYRKILTQNGNYDAGNIKEKYTAVLLVCDAIDKNPDVFYSVKSSIGGSLSFDGEKLIWDVCEINGVELYPAASSFSLIINALISEYSFGADGKFESAAPTEQSARIFR